MYSWSSIISAFNQEFQKGLLLTSKWLNVFTGQRQEGGDKEVDQERSGSICWSIYIQPAGFVIFLFELKIKGIQATKLF